MNTCSALAVRIIGTMLVARRGGLSLTRLSAAAQRQSHPWQQTGITSVVTSVRSMLQRHDGDWVTASLSPCSLYLKVRHHDRLSTDPARLCLGTGAVPSRALARLHLDCIGWPYSRRSIGAVGSAANPPLVTQLVTKS